MWTYFVAIFVLCTSLTMSKFPFEKIIEIVPFQSLFSKLNKWSLLRLHFPKRFTSSHLHPFLSFSTLKPLFWGSFSWMLLGAEASNRSSDYLTLFTPTSPIGSSRTPGSFVKLPAHCVPKIALQATSFQTSALMQKIRPELSVLRFITLQLGH